MVRYEIAAMIRANTYVNTTRACVKITQDMFSKFCFTN